MKQYFITTKEVQRLFSLSPTAAYNRIALVREALGKKKLGNGRYQPVTVREFCEYYGLGSTEKSIFKN
ncbi:MAG: hypothetical protein LBU42_01540 [Prevotellaceae bacterium]|jgi:hypothetical protein|nr:hypothetical protein [Prevotellaceae bacterium]